MEKVKKEYIVPNEMVYEIISKVPVGYDNESKGNDARIKSTNSDTTTDENNSNETNKDPWTKW